MSQEEDTDMVSADKVWLEVLRDYQKRIQELEAKRKELEAKVKSNDSTFKNLGGMFLRNMPAGTRDV